MKEDIIGKQFDLLRKLKEKNPGLEITTNAELLSKNLAAKLDFNTNIPLSELNLPLGFEYDEELGITNGEFSLKPDEEIIDDNEIEESVEPEVEPVVEKKEDPQVQTQERKVGSDNSMPRNDGELHSFNSVNMNEDAWRDEFDRRVGVIHEELFSIEEKINIAESEGRQVPAEDYKRLRELNSALTRLANEDMDRSIGRKVRNNKGVDYENDPTFKRERKAKNKEIKKLENRLNYASVGEREALLRVIEEKNVEMKEIYDAHDRRMGRLPQAGIAERIGELPRSYSENRKALNEDPAFVKRTSNGNTGNPQVDSALRKQSNTQSLYSGKRQSDEIQAERQVEQERQEAERKRKEELEQAKAERTTPPLPQHPMDGNAQQNTPPQIPSQPTRPATQQTSTSSAQNVQVNNGQGQVAVNSQQGFNTLVTTLTDMAKLQATMVNSPNVAAALQQVITILSQEIVKVASANSIDISDDLARALNINRPSAPVQQSTPVQQTSQPINSIEQEFNSVGFSRQGWTPGFVESALGVGQMIHAQEQQQTVYFDASLLKKYINTRGTTITVAPNTDNLSQRIVHIAFLDESGQEQIFNQIVEDGVNFDKNVAPAIASMYFESNIPLIGEPTQISTGNNTFSEIRMTSTAGVNFQLIGNPALVSNTIVSAKTVVNNAINVTMAPQAQKTFKPAERYVPVQRPVETPTTNFKLTLEVAHPFNVSAEVRADIATKYEAVIDDAGARLVPVQQNKQVAQRNNEAKPNVDITQLRNQSLQREKAQQEQAVRNTVVAKQANEKADTDYRVNAEDMDDFYKKQVFAKIANEQIVMDIIRDDKANQRTLRISSVLDGEQIELIKYQYPDAKRFDTVTLPKMIRAYADLNTVKDSEIYNTRLSNGTLSPTFTSTSNEKNSINLVGYSIEDCTRVQSVIGERAERLTRWHQDDYQPISHKTEETVANTDPLISEQPKEIIGLPAVIEQPVFSKEEAIRVAQEAEQRKDTSEESKQLSEIIDADLIKQEPTTAEHDAKQAEYDKLALELYQQDLDKKEEAKQAAAAKRRATMEAKKAVGEATKDEKPQQVPAKSESAQRPQENLLDDYDLAAGAKQDNETVSIVVHVPEEDKNAREVRVILNSAETPYQTSYKYDNGAEFDNTVLPEIINKYVEVNGTGKGETTWHPELGKIAEQDNHVGAYVNTAENGNTIQFSGYDASMVKSFEQQINTIATSLQNEAQGKQP